MRTLASLALAGSLAAAALAPTVTAASAHDWDHHHRYYHGGGWYGGGGGFLAGTALGLTFGALASPYYYPPAYGYYPPPPPPPLYAAGAGDAHIEWCAAHYRSYNAETNLWVDYDGVMHQCMAPY